ncbi:MAG: plasmid recombination protein [Deltaproteobacteria bacterium]|nr:plasmid recombination protein [Deltaproteobacteria bacterium]
MSGIWCFIKHSKIKNWTNLEETFAHNARLVEVVNADQKRTRLNQLLLGPEALDPKAYCLERLKGQSIHCNQILATAMILETSPEFFRPGRVSEPGLYFPEKLDPWALASQKWLTTTFGDLAFSAYLHLDEVTPHIHALIIPLKPSGTLSWSSMFRPYKLLEYGQSYFRSLQHLGVQRYGGRAPVAKTQKRVNYYPYVERANYPNLFLKPFMAPALNWPPKISSLWPFTPEKIVMEASLKALALESQTLLARIESQKAILALENRQLKAFMDKVYLRFEAQQKAKKLQYLLDDKLFKHWLATTPGVMSDPMALAPRRSYLETKRPTLNPPVLSTPKATKKLGKVLAVTTYRAWSSPEFEGFFQIGFTKFKVGPGSYWRDLTNQVQGQGSIAFFASLLDYSSAQTQQIVNLIANYKQISRISNHPQQILARCLAVDLVRQAPLKLAHSLKLLPEDPKKKLDPKELEKLELEKKAKIKMLFDSAKPLYWPVQKSQSAPYKEPQKKIPLKPLFEPTLDPDHPKMKF